MSEHSEQINKEQDPTAALLEELIEEHRNIRNGLKGILVVVLGVFFTFVGLPIIGIPNLIGGTIAAIWCLS